jgi:hypothetical protein
MGHPSRVSVRKSVDCEDKVGFIPPWVGQAGGQLQGKAHETQGTHETTQEIGVWGTRRWWRGWKGCVGCSFIFYRADRLARTIHGR